MRYAPPPEGSGFQFLDGLIDKSNDPSIQHIGAIIGLRQARVSAEQAGNQIVSSLSKFRWNDPAFDSLISDAANLAQRIDDLANALLLYSSCLTSKRLCALRNPDLSAFIEPVVEQPGPENSQAPECAPSTSHSGAKVSGGAHEGS